MAEAVDIRLDFAALAGQLAWRVSRIHGSMFFLEIGGKETSTYQLRGEERVFTHGKWHFMFHMTQWRFESEGQILVACEDEQPNIDHIFSNMALGAVKEISLSLPGQDLLMTFESGISLRTFSNSGQQEWDQWTLYCPDDRCWTADGRSKLISQQGSESRPEASV